MYRKRINYYRIALGHIFFKRYFELIDIFIDAQQSNETVLCGTVESKNDAHHYEAKNLSPVIAVMSVDFFIIKF